MTDREKVAARQLCQRVPETLFKRLTGTPQFLFAFQKPEYFISFIIDFDWFPPTTPHPNSLLQTP